MQIDIEKLNRRTPYPEPSEDFFRKIQDNVISKTIEGDHAQILTRKEAKVFSLNFKWMAAAAVVLISGITAFFEFNNDSDISMVKQKPIIDSVYGIEQFQQSSPVQMAENTASSETPQEILQQKTHSKHKKMLAVSDSNTKISASLNISDTQSYAVDTKKKSELDVEKVLAAFTPDQLKDIDKNSEQDVYLDLYN